MKQVLETLLAQSLKQLEALSLLAFAFPDEIRVERTRDTKHGDFASNLALMLAKPAGLSPRDVAQMIINHLPTHPALKKVEIAGPGFINFFMEESAIFQPIIDILEQQENYGKAQVGAGQKVILEFVSSNPTGPLHVGHGRSAAYGASLANILSFAGFNVHREYYVNDAGRQMEILALSVWLRYLQHNGEKFNFPVNGYQGDYVLPIAELLFHRYEKKFYKAWSDISTNLPPDAPVGDKEIYIDALIKQAKSLLGQENFQVIHQVALKHVLNDIQEDLAEFGVHFDEWFSEKSLETQGDIAKGIQALKDAGHTYELEGALWFRATAFGDEKDRVLVRANGQSTYFASDVAYHWNKYARGFVRVIDIFGADHHGYLTRVKSAVRALGHNDEALTVLLVQFAILFRQGQRVQMSTRSGSFVTLRELRAEVGNDAARFFYIMRKPEQHMDFDLDLAKSQSNDNPVYYIQYAHARICSVFRQLQERKLNWNKDVGLKHLTQLNSPQELQLILLIGKYPEIISTAAVNCEPHQLAYFLRELAAALHSYYNAITLLIEDENLRSARLNLLDSVRQVLKNGLELLGVSTPESM